ncbi:MAG: molybdenum cofactor guanylyltransferase [Proteobacteria bacterium]|nr:molybdenum cofactor guanylyltransferase [Pseudomonadota bacterium]
MSIAGVILAGGKSSRMGTDKAKLLIKNKTLLAHCQQILTDTGISSIHISGKDGIQDNYYDKGPLAGIAACLEQLKHYDFVLFLPVDMPLINKYALLKLISEKNQTAIYFNNFFFPLLIHNNLSTRKIIKQQLDNNILSIKNTLKQLGAKSIKNHFPKLTFLNINTQDDWLKIKTSVKTLIDC